MSDKTGIEWTDATWNPVTGCTKVSQGCKNCYAKRDWARLAAMPNNVYSGREFEQVACHSERLDQPLHWRKPRRVFVNSMSDLFHDDVPDKFIDRVFAVMALSPQHAFQVLTKRPERMLSWFGDRYRYECIYNAMGWLGDKGYTDRYPFRTALPLGMLWPLKNVWLGVSAEDQATADERIPLLLQTPAAVRWISAEPLLGAMTLRGKWLGCSYQHRGAERKKYACNPVLDWVVVGGESGPNARPVHPEWARSLRDQCVAAGVPYFFKQWGNWLPEGQEGDPIHSPWKSKTSDYPILTTKRAAGRILDGRTWDEYPA